MDVLGRVTLVTGSEEYLNERTVAAVKDAVKRHDAEAELGETRGTDLTLATLGELAAPSLFSAVRCVVVREIENLPDESVDGLLGYCAAPAEEVALVLVHGGGQKGSGVLAKLRKLPAVTEQKSAAVKAWELPKFVAAECKQRRATIDPSAAEVLVQAVGADLRSLVAAIDQLVSDHPGERLTEDVVRMYFGGRAEVKNYEIADAIIGGRRARALQELRWAFEAGTSEVYILATLAGQLRTVADHVAGVRDGGLPPWKAKQVRSQAQGWTEKGITRAIRAVAQADADIKGAAGDAPYTLERLVLTIAGLREAR